MKKSNLINLDYINNQSLIYSNVEEATKEWFDLHISLGGRVGLWNPTKDLSDTNSFYLTDAKKRVLSYVNILKSNPLKSYDHFNNDLKLRNAIQFFYMIGNAESIVYRPLLIQIGKQYNVHPGFTRLIARTLAGLDNTSIYIEYKTQRPKNIIPIPQDVEYFSSANEFLNALSYTNHIPKYILKANRLQEDMKTINICGIHFENDLQEVYEWTHDLQDNKIWYDYYPQTFEIADNLKGLDNIK